MSRSLDPLASISLCPSPYACLLAGHRGLQWLFLTLKKRWKRQVGLCTVPGVGSRILQGVGSCGGLSPRAQHEVGRDPRRQEWPGEPLEFTLHTGGLGDPSVLLASLVCFRDPPWWPVPPCNPVSKAGRWTRVLVPTAGTGALLVVSELLLAEEVVFPDRLSPRNCFSQVWAWLGGSST